jgi:uncharacterized membrane protein
MPQADIPPLTGPCDFCVVSRRHDSLGPRLRWQVFASLCAVSLVLALGFAAMGAWLVLPYSVLEMALVYLAFRYVERGSGDWERVAVVGDRLILERATCGSYHREEFNRYWVKVDIEVSSGARCKVALRYAGRAVAFGAQMPDAERRDAALRLRRALASA